jgi:hypothetical protein
MTSPDNLVKTDTTERAWASYAIAGMIGVVASVYAMPSATLIGTGGLFQGAAGDLAVNLLGHLAFQTPGWHWPILRAPELGWPTGASIAMTDSNPALSLVAKLMSGVIGHPVNLFAVWLAACLVLKPVGAVYAMPGVAGGEPEACGAPSGRGGGGGLDDRVAAAGISVPHRIGQFVRPFSAPDGDGMDGAALDAGAGSVGGVVGGVPDADGVCAFLPFHVRGGDAGGAGASGPGAAAGRGAGGFAGLDAGDADSDRGFYAGQFYARRRRSGIWAVFDECAVAGLAAAFRAVRRRSADLDATGYQREGFNYLGAGVLVLLGCAGWVLARGAGRRGGRFGGILAGW